MPLETLKEKKEDEKSEEEIALAFLAMRWGITDLSPANVAKFTKEMLAFVERMEALEKRVAELETR